MRILWGLCALLALVAGCANTETCPDWLKPALKDANGDRMRMSGEQYSPYSPQSGR